MIQVSAASIEAARRLWDEECVDPTTPVVVGEAIERVCLRLRLGFDRWIGVDGYRVLFQRVVEESIAEHPTLAGLRCLSDGDSTAEGTVPADALPAVIRGFVSVVALLIQLLSDVIGEDMAMRLVEQATANTQGDPGG